jgi:hypothetical protein
MSNRSSIASQSYTLVMFIFFLFFTSAFSQTLEQQHNSQSADKASKETEKKRALIEDYKKSFDDFRSLIKANMVRIHFKLDSSFKFSACVDGQSFLTDGVYLLLQKEDPFYHEGFYSNGYKVCGKLDNKGNFLNTNRDWVAQIQLNAVRQCQQEGGGSGKIFFKAKYIDGVQELGFICGIQSSEKPWVVEYFSRLNEIFEEKCRTSYNRCPIPAELKKLVLDFKEENKAVCVTTYNKWIAGQPSWVNLREHTYRSPC